MTQTVDDEASAPIPAAATGRRRRSEPLLNELSRPGIPGHALPALDVPDASADLGGALGREQLPLPAVGELDLVRHFTHLAAENYSVDSGFYPLGSCTMKYNPRINEDVARMPGLARLHPLQPRETVQGALRLLYELQQLLAEITGFDAATLQPAAGAQGELAGMLMIRAYHQARGQGHRRKVLVPDSAHGTNPATAAMCGAYTVAIPTDRAGNVDLARLEAELDDTTAALMLTNPNTLGLFEQHLGAVARAVHSAGALLYGDGANLNAILGVVRPADVGFDCLHINVHKTFSTPHGGGGPGAGPVVVREALEPFLPTPVVARLADGTYALDQDRPRSIGRLKAFHGHSGILARAYTYIRMHGAEGLRSVGETAVLNANYLRACLQELYEVPFDRSCMHEVVMTGRRQAVNGVRTLDLAKRLIDYGIHPPTMYFPLIVEEALLVEPTEVESRATLDAFVAAMRAIAREAEEAPDLLHAAPHGQVVGRLDEVRAARKPVLRWNDGAGAIAV